MFKRLLATTAATVAVVGLQFAGPAHADTVLSNSGRTSNSFISEPGANCMRNGASSYLEVKPPTGVEANYSYNSQYVGWRTVIYRWNGSSWGSPYKYGAIQTALTKPRSSAAFAGAQRFTLGSGYYQATMQIFWYSPATGQIEGTKWHRADQVRLMSISPIGAVNYNGNGSYCTI